MAVTMVPTGTESRRTIARGLPGTLALLAVLGAPQAQREWELHPYLGLELAYTDNVYLGEESTAESSWVSVLNPGLRFSARGSRGEADGYLALERLDYSAASDLGTDYQQGRLNGTVELWRERLTLEAGAGLTQRVVDPTRGVPQDNINVGNRTDAREWTLSPRLTLPLGRAGDFSGTWSHRAVSYGEGLADAVTRSWNLGLDNERSRARLGWVLGYGRQETVRDGVDDLVRESATAELSWLYNRRFSLLLEGGYRDPNLGGAATSAAQIRSGGYWGLGGVWLPRRDLRLKAVAGDSYESAALDWGAGARTRLSLAWRNRDVGTNPGSVWTADLAWSGRHSRLGLGYFEDTVSYQELSVEQLCLDPGTGEVRPCTGAVGEIPLLDGFVLTDEVFVRRRGTFSWSLSGRRNTVAVSYIHERRRLLESGERDLVWTGTASWTLQASARSAVTAAITRRSGAASGTGTREEELETASIGLRHELSPDLAADALVRRTRFDSPGLGRSYTENRVQLGLRATF